MDLAFIFQHWSIFLEMLILKVLTVRRDNLSCSLTLPDSSLSQLPVKVASVYLTEGCHLHRKVLLRMLALPKVVIGVPF